MSPKPTSIEDAKAAFWKVIAEIHPECPSGDLSWPDSQDFDQTCADAVEAWREANMTRTSPLAVLKALGFEECSTGGGCTALEYTRPDGEQCLVTNDALAPKPSEGWDVGFYDVDHAQIDCTWYAAGTLVAALARIAAWRLG